MKNFQKGASTIRQCTRCFSLRDDNDIGPCTTCLLLFNEVNSACDILPLADVEHDLPEQTSLEDFLIRLMTSPESPTC